jgi:hypothetical protein
VQKRLSTKKWVNVLVNAPRSALRCGAGLFFFFFDSVTATTQMETVAMCHGRFSFMCLALCLPFSFSPLQPLYVFRFYKAAVRIQQINNFKSSFLRKSRQEEERKKTAPARFVKGERRKERAKGITGKRACLSQWTKVPLSLSQM